MNLSYKIYLALALLATAVACDRDAADDTHRQPQESMIETSIGLDITDATRTVLGDDGMTTQWSVGDNIALWARNASGEYIVESARFSLRNFSADYSTALFSGRTAAMEQGSYDYFMIYPLPTSVAGTQATYDIPAVQSGAYDARCDVMIASPVTGEALSADKTARLSATMRHMMHAVKITIPEDRNLFGQRFTRLEMTFPYPVAGRVTFDVTSPDAAPAVSDTSNTIVIESAEGFDAGDTLWVFVLPSASAVDGEISYMVSNDTSRSEQATYAVSLDMRPGHVTPIKMTVPTIYKYTSFEFTVAANNLGEDFNKLMIYDASNTMIAEFVRNDENVYKMEFLGDFEHTDWSGTDFRLSFDSEHATVETAVNIGTIQPYSIHRFTTVVPYLFEENFDLITDSNGSEYSTESNSNYGTSSAGNKNAISFLNGWTGARIGLSSGNAIRIACRRETSADYPARVDSAPMSCLKSEVKVRVTFDYGMDRQEGGIGSAPKLGQTLHLGYVTANTAYKSDDTDGTFIEEFYINETGASYTNIPHTGRSFEIPACTASTRITWRTTNEHKAGFTNGTFWLYIDNVKVQIANN